MATNTWPSLTNQATALDVAIDNRYLVLRDLPGADQGFIDDNYANRPELTGEHTAFFEYVAAVNAHVGDIIDLVLAEPDFHTDFYEV